MHLRHCPAKEYEDGQSTDANRKSDSPFHCTTSSILRLNLDVFRLSLPTQRSLFDHLCYSVHDDNHDHQDDDPNEYIRGLENSRRHPDKKADPFRGSDKFTDNGADNGKGDARADTGKDIGRNGWEDNFKSQLPSFDSHKLRQVDIFAVHLPHSGIGIKKI